MIKQKIKRLENFLKDKKCILAFSGGSDSTLIAYILSRLANDSLLVTIDNNMMPENFIKHTQQMAEKLNLKHIIINKDFLSDPKFIANDEKRCYMCRKCMYQSIKQLPEYQEYDYLLEGTNITDMLEDRPGVLINEE